MKYANIPTGYKGITYRSRTEARWAVFFTKNNIPFQYETEGFDIGGLRYVPDFWLPYANCWFEVKPFDPLPVEEEKALRLAWATGRLVFIAPGAPASEIGLHVYSPSGKSQSGWRFAYAHEEGPGYICDNLWNYTLKVKIRETDAGPGMYGHGPEGELREAGEYQFDVPRRERLAPASDAPKGRLIPVQADARRKIGRL